MSPKSSHRGDSSSPAEGKTNGDGALPLTRSNLLRNELAESVKKPYSPFAQQDDAAADGKFGANNRAKLSAGANIFKPKTVKQAPTPIRILNHASTADDQPTIVMSPTPATTGDGAKSKTGIQQPIGTRTGTKSPPRPRVFFTTDVGPDVEFQGGHYIKIENVLKTELSTGSLTILADDFGWNAKLLGSKAQISADGKIYSYVCAFDDLRDASAAFAEVEMVGRDWPIKYISQTEYASANEFTKHRASYHDGQVIFAVNFDGQTAEFDANAACDAAHKLAGSCGDMRAFTQIASPYPHMEFRVEYFSINAGHYALSQANAEKPHVVGKWSIIAKELPSGSPATVVEAANGIDGIQNSIAGMNVTSTLQKNGDRVEYTSPTGRTAWRVDENGNQVPAPPSRVLPKVGAIPFGTPITAANIQRERFFSAPSPHTPSQFMEGVFVQPRSGSWNGICYSHDTSPRRFVAGPQAVEIWKIECGQDVRTTVMLRNIPNRMSYRELKAIIDVTSFGMYDFSYLRIDFEKGTNVGYAFVNFADPMSIISFVSYYGTRRWLSNNPRRVELSYATVQGFDCLVEKFRNSAIMSEWMDYRPKLWYTHQTAPAENTVGTEMPFPAPNNLSKKQRSHDNAGQIGLYAPRTGHMSRERGRRSQFDRGTPSQLQEDTFYGQMSPVNGYGGGYGYNMPARGPVGPPPPFQYGNGYNNMGGPFFHGNGMMPNQAYVYGPWDCADPFGPSGYNGGYPHDNGFGNGNAIGTGPNTPASRLRTQTAGRLGGRPRNVTTVGGPVQYPGGGHGNQNGQRVEQDVMSPEKLAAHKAAVDDEGYNETLGPFYCPRY